MLTKKEGFSGVCPRIETAGANLGSQDDGCSWLLWSAAPQPPTGLAGSPDSSGAAAAVLPNPSVRAAGWKASIHREDEPRVAQWSQ